MALKRTTVLEIKDLAIRFTTNKQEVHALRGVDLKLYRGETLAIVGESGSGKSVTAKAVMGILDKNGHIEGGEVHFNYRLGEKGCHDELLRLPNKELRKRINGKRIAMVFQDPLTSLDPTMTIGNQITEGLRLHLRFTKQQARERALELLELVGIDDPPTRLRNYPHQLSGGMRQRVVIAIAISCLPDVLICDEPTTALDVTIQAKILELIRDLQKKLGLSVIYITHDLGVVAKIADYVSVMYAGRIVEKGSVEDIFYDPRHPYTWGLLLSIPNYEVGDASLYTIPGAPPRIVGEMTGDPFAPRNLYALNIDHRLEAPLFRVPGSQSHYAATWLLHKDAPKVSPPPELVSRIQTMLEEGRSYAI
ncbi:MAG: ABC transporter ATP-binding protein [Coriobacteriales bacterium]|jgi:oligopeptide transport system ATP-binding protein|nr:ABC transporter ATP-binding protein [Coriobacteriales bacterium]